MLTKSNCICFLEYFVKIYPSPEDNSLRGIGYSFSNVGNNRNRNEVPYFAVGAVNNDASNFNHNTDAVLLFSTSPFCINLKRECKSTLEITPKSITRDTTGNEIWFLNR